MNIISADSESLATLKNAIGTAYDEYKYNLQRMRNLAEQIINGDIKGNLATEFINKFESHSGTLNALETTLDEAAQYMGLQTTKYDQLIENTQAGMR